MTMRIGLLGAGLLALSACNSAGDSGGTTAAPVAAVKPPAGTEWTTTVAATPDGGYRMGNPNAPIKLIEYGSRACPFCARFSAEGMPLLKQNYVATGKVSYEFREFPVHGALDLAPILLGRCDSEPTSFFPMLEQMFASQEALLAKEQAVDRQIKTTMAAAPPSAIATAYAEGLGYLDFVTQRGIPEAKARACLTNQAGFDAIEKSYQTANSKYQVSGTPTFVLNEKVIPGNLDWKQLEIALKAAGA